MKDDVKSRGLGLGQAIERIAAMPAFLEAALEQGRDHLKERPSAESFSLVEHACHLRDVEREAFLVRVRRMISEERPAFEGYDGGAVAKARDYPSQDARRAAQEFAATRREVVGLISALTPADLAKPATFGGEPLTFERLIGMIAEHDREHRAEIEQILAKG